MTIAPTAGLTRLPAFLTGTAGATIETLGELRGFGSMSRYILDSTANGRASASQATHAFSLIGQHADHASVRSAIDGIRPELRHVFGVTGQRRVSSELQARSSQIGAAREILALPRVDAASAAEAAMSGHAAATQLIATIDEALPALRAEARATAAKRLAIGTGAAAGGIVLGRDHLARSSGTPVAPGPFNDRPSPGGDQYA